MTGNKQHPTTFFIRPALQQDPPGIARLQVDSYRTAYAGLIPQDYLDHFTYDEQEQDWREWLVSHAEDILLVAVDDREEVIGYVLARLQADIYPGHDAEIMAMHVRREFQRQGVGKALWQHVVQELHQRGCQSVMLWTLQGNPVRAWYEKLGGRLLGEKSFEIDDQKIVEVAYGWPLKTLL